MNHNGTESAIRDLALRSPSSRLDERVFAEFVSDSGEAAVSGSSVLKSEFPGLDQSAERVRDNYLHPGTRRGSVVMMTVGMSLAASLVFCLAGVLAPLNSSGGAGQLDRDHHVVQNSSGAPDFVSSQRDAEGPVAAMAIDSGTPLSRSSQRSSQITESSQQAAWLLAVAWEQQSGQSFPAILHVKDVRFSACRTCHSSLSRRWHSDQQSRSELTMCQNCHQSGG